MPAGKRPVRPRNATNAISKKPGVRRTSPAGVSRSQRALALKRANARQAARKSSPAKTISHPRSSPGTRRGPDLSKAFASARATRPRAVRTAREFSQQNRARRERSVTRTPRRRLVQPGAGRRIAASAGRRFMRAARGAARVSAPYLRRAKQSVSAASERAFEKGLETFDSIGETAIDYSFNTVQEATRSAGSIAENATSQVIGTAEFAGGELTETAGHLGREIAGSGGMLARELGSASGEIARAAGSGIISTSGNLAGTLIGLGADGANSLVNGADRGIRAAAKGLFVRLPKAAAQKVVGMLSNRRVFREHVNPNLAGGWKMMMRREGIPVTEDGFVVHSIKSKPLTVSRGIKKEILMDVEFGFNEAGEFHVRAKPVFNGASEAENALIERAYSRNFGSTRRAVKSFVRHIGRKKGARRIVERYMSEAAFPEKPFVCPETEAVRAQAPVPGETALTEADINAAMAEARQARERVTVQ